MTQHPSILVRPQRLAGSVSVPMSKSQLHRGLIMSMLSGSLALTALDSDSMSQDIKATYHALEQLMAAPADAEPIRIFCNESGSTLRFLIPLAAVLGKNVVFEGAGRLPFRPLAEYEEIFKNTGASISFLEDGRYLPMALSGKLDAGIFRVPGHVSSQYISGLMMALSVANEDSQILLTSRLESEPYVEMTREVMREFGAVTHKIDGGYRVCASKVGRASSYQAEPDFSQAAFWLVANYLGASIEVKDMPIKSMQGDSEILHLIKALDEYADVDDILVLDGDMDYFNVDASQIPDIIPVFSLACAASACRTKIFNAGRLRIKECDRLEATYEMLCALGVDVQLEADSLLITGKDGSEGDPVFRSCEIDSRSDHRMVMAAAIAATRADGPIKISDYRAIDKSYPTFFRDYRRVGGQYDELDVGK